MVKELGKMVLIIFLALVMLLSINVAMVSAVTESDINAKGDEINRTKEKLDGVEEQLKGTLKQIEKLKSDISSYENDIESLDRQISEVETKISEAEANLKETEEKYERQKESFAERLVAIYEAGETTYLDVLLSSHSIVDFITNYYLVEDMAECDNNMLELMEKNRVEIETAKEVLEQNKQNIASLKRSKEQTVLALRDSKVTQQNYADQLTEDEKALKEEIEKLEKEQKQMQAELEAASNKYANEIANLGGSGTLQRPVKGGVVTCNMYYSSGKYHGAMDIGISEGTKVYAAEEGIILHAGWNSTGYGFLTVIQHANGLRTYYGHGNGTIYVKEGQKVERGQLIMLSGNTGNSSGPHLHFEVRVSPYKWVYGGGNGDCRRDPRNYL